MQNNINYLLVGFVSLYARVNLASTPFGGSKLMVVRRMIAKPGSTKTI